MTGRLGNRRRTIVVWCLLLAAATVVAWLVVARFSSPTSGADDERSAVTGYVKALNTGSASSLDDYIHPSGPGVAQKILASARVPLVVTSMVIHHDFGPAHATAEIVGTAGGAPIHTILSLVLDGGRWYVATPSAPDPSAGPTASAG